MPPTFPRFGASRKPRPVQVANCCDPREKVPMYIGLGALVFVLVVVAIIYFVRRA
jgi:hypothetical protein